MLLIYKYINKKRGDNKGYRKKIKYTLRSELYFRGYYTMQTKKN